MSVRNGTFVSNLYGGWLVLELCEKSWLFLNLSLRYNPVTNNNFRHQNSVDHFI